MFSGILSIKFVMLFIAVQVLCDSSETRRQSCQGQGTVATYLVWNWPGRAPVSFAVQWTVSQRCILLGGLQPGIQWCHPHGSTLKAKGCKIITPSWHASGFSLRVLKWGSRGLPYVNFRGPLIRFRNNCLKEVNPLSTYHNCSRWHFEILFFRENKVWLHVNCLPIHMKCQALFSLENKIKF